MADVKKLRSDIQKLKKALQAKGVSKTVKDKLQGQLDKAESELAASKKPAKSAKPKKSTPLNRLQSLVKKKKYSAYSKAGVDLKKDAGQPALPTGKRTSKSGKTYYEYRANRIDVKQPPKRYPKLEDGGETSDGKIRFDMYGYIHANDRKQDGDEIIRVSSYKEAEEKAEKFLKENKYELVELYRKDDFVGSIRTKKNFVYSSKYKKEDFADGGMMADGGRITKGLKWKQEWTDSKGVEGYDILEVDDTNYFSNRYSGGMVVRSKIIESSKPERIGNFQEETKAELRKILSGKYPFAYKLKDGGYMAEGGVIFLKSVSTYFRPSDMTVSSEKSFKNEGEIISLNDVDEEWINKLSVEDNKTIFNAMLSKHYKDSKGMADGGMMAKGGYVAVSEKDGYWYIVSRPTTKETAQKIADNQNKSFGYSYKGEINKVVTVEEAKAHNKLIGEEYLADGGEIEVGDKVKYKNAKYHATVERVIYDVPIPYAEIRYSDGKGGKAYLEDLQKVELRIAKEYVNPDYMAEGGGVGAKEYKLVPMIPYGVKGYLEPDYKNTIRFKGTEDEATSKAKELAASNPNFVRVEIKREMKTKVVTVGIVDGQNTNYADGGGIPKGYHKMPDGTIMADSAHMAYGGYMAQGGLTKEKLMDIEEEFEENEDDNYHSENVVLLARYFGTKEDLKEARSILKKHKEEGYLSGDNSKKRYDLSMKLFDKWDEAKKEAGIMAKGGEVKVGDIITAKTGVKVKVVEYDPKFGGRVKVMRMDEYGTGEPSQFMRLSKFKYGMGGYMAEGGVMSTTHRLSK